MFLCPRNPNPFTTCHKDFCYLSACFPLFCCFPRRSAASERRGAVAPCGRQGARRLPDGGTPIVPRAGFTFRPTRFPPGRGSVSPASTWTGITASGARYGHAADGRPFPGGQYADFVERQIDCALSAYRKFGVTQGEDHEPYHFLRKFSRLDHCGAECAAMIELAARRPAKTEAYAPYIERAAEHIRHGQARFPDGTLVRTWPHRHTPLGRRPLHGAVVHVALRRTFRRPGDAARCRAAGRTVPSLSLESGDGTAVPRLLRRSGTYGRGALGPLQRLGDAGHGAAYGCPACRGPRPAAVAGAARTTDRRRGETPVRFRAVASAARPGGFLRGSSCSAISSTAWRTPCARWIDARYASAALKGWEALPRKKITPEGDLRDICVGTGIGNDMPFYYNRPKVDGETHGTGLLLDAGLEILRLRETELINPEP